MTKYPLAHPPGGQRGDHMTRQFDEENEPTRRPRRAVIPAYSLAANTGGRARRQQGLL